MQKNMSPEEKLLSIIKTKRNVPEGAAPDPVKKDISLPLKGPWVKIDGYISAALKNDFLKNSVLNTQVLKTFNRYALILAVIIAAYLILDGILVNPSKKAQSLLDEASISGPADEIAEKAQSAEVKAYPYYSNRISGKNVFGPGSNIESQTSGIDQSQGSSGDNLGLVGIIPGDSPQAIIEDKKAQKTYYLVKGQSINGITVEDVSEDKVALEYMGKKTTLFL